MGTLKRQSNGPLYSNTMIGTLAVDGWAASHIWYSEKQPGRAAAPPSPLLAVPNVTAHPSTASVPTSYYWTWHYNCLCTTVWKVNSIRAVSDDVPREQDTVLTASSPLTHSIIQWLAAPFIRRQPLIDLSQHLERALLQQRTSDGPWSPGAII